MIKQFKFFKFKIQKGFTIVELMIYMGLLVGFLVITSTLFATILDTQLESEANSSIEQDGRYILARLSYDIQQATDITSPALPGDSGTTLILATTPVNTYQITNGNLQLNGEQLNSESTTVSNFTVTKVGNAGGKPTAQVSFTVTTKVQRNTGNNSKTFQTTIGTR